MSRGDPTSDVDSDIDGVLDPIDHLRASAKFGPTGDGKIMDFIRKKVNTLSAENKDLKQRIADVEATLSVVQTAQQWSEENFMSAEQAAKVKEVTNLILEARQAREEALTFSKVGKGALAEQIRQYKTELKKERQSKREMKQRLLHAFNQARVLKEEHAAFLEKQQEERLGRDKLLHKVRERHRAEMEQLERAVAKQTEKTQKRMEQVTSFGERVMADLNELQEQMRIVREEQYEPLTEEDDDDDQGGFFITQPVATA
jgi:hypothetical protein